MLSKINSIGLFGLEGFAVEVETDVHRSENDFFEIVGLPDLAVKESRNRIKAAIANSGYHFPELSIMINLAPAHIRKEGSAYDLPMVLGILSAMEKIPQPSKKAAFLGEIALSGQLRPSVGVLASVINAKELGFDEIYIPYANICEGAVIDGISVYGVRDISSLVEHLRGENIITPTRIPIDSLIENNYEFVNDFSSIIGQHSARRACEIAAAGGHNLLFIGPPGTGKSMLAKSMPSILPDLNMDEMIECSKIYSIAGKLSDSKPLIIKRPFVKANQGVSSAGLLGGGSFPGPGVISLAHHGVLFIDEMPEFPQKVLESLRQPMEDNSITISRVKRTLTYPSSFTLVCAMNPCPCGNFGHPTLQCSCTDAKVSNYINKISGPLLDRIDIQVELQPVKLSDITNSKPEENSEAIKKRVDNARKKQVERFKNTKTSCNAKMNPSQIKECKIENAAIEFLRKIFVKMSLSMRAYDKIIKISQTIADIEGSDIIKSDHIAEAVFFRSLDKKYWNR